MRKIMSMRERVNGPGKQMVVARQQRDPWEIQAQDLREAASRAACFSPSPEPPGCFGGRHGIGRVGHDQVHASAK